MPHPIAFTFSAGLWLAEVQDAAWVFVTVPPDVSDEIAERAPRAPGFGSVRVEATIGATTWRTSLFPDTKRRAYLLPIKNAVRTAESIDVGDEVTVDLELPVE